MGFTRSKSLFEVFGHYVKQLYLNTECKKQQLAYLGRDQIRLLWKGLGATFYYICSQNMGNLFGRFWKMALLSKICCLYFWSKLCYFLFQHLVTLGSCMIPIFFVAKKVHCPIFFFHPFSCFSSRKFSDENLLRNIKNQFRLKFCAQMADVLPADLVVVYQVRSCTLKKFVFYF